MQSLAVPPPAIRTYCRSAVKTRDVPCRIQYRRADFAVFQVAARFLTQIGLDSLRRWYSEMCSHTCLQSVHSSLRRTHLRGGAVVLRKGTSRFCSRIRAPVQHALSQRWRNPSACAVSSTFSALPGLLSVKIAGKCRSSATAPPQRFS